MVGEAESGKHRKDLDNKERIGQQMLSLKHKRKGIT